MAPHSAGRAPRRPRWHGAFCCMGFAALATLAASTAAAMDVRVSGDQLILSGPVVDGDLPKIEHALKRNPRLATVILRNSPGGHPQTGFRVGELIRARGLTTAVSGYCHSSCSRMYLGGVRRVFTDDFPPGVTTIGFHGHYKKDGSLDPELMRQTGLRDWILRFLGGQPDAALVDRWVNIPRNNGLVYFFNPALVRRAGASTFFCSGGEPADQRPFNCERVALTALEQGVSTSTEIIRSNDQAELGAVVRPLPPADPARSVDDPGGLPVQSAAALADYRQFLALGMHRAFAVSESKAHWGWSAGSLDATATALASCAERAKGPCRLYAIDGEVVWREP